MKWPWTKPIPPPQIPPYPPVVVKPKEPRDPDMIVTESELSETGMWRLFKRKPKE